MALASQENVGLRRGQTVYIKDIVPETMKDLLKDPAYDLDKIILRQIKIVTNSKKDLEQRRKHMLKTLDEECSKNNNSSCGPFDSEFLHSVLKDVEKDETEARRKVLGEQESVEMFKAAFTADAVSEDHLTAARAYRDSMTRQLCEVVEAREILLVALEILKRSAAAYMPQNNPEMESQGIAYVKEKERYLKECEILKKLTEWKKKPELHITEEEELFSFFTENDDNIDEPDGEELPVHSRSPKAVVKEESSLGSALASCEAESQKLVHFKSTKVDIVDNEFGVVAELATDILQKKKDMEEALAFIQQACSHQGSTTIGIEKFMSYFRMKYSKFKFKISTKGYNFSLKAMRRTKSVVSLSILTNLLDVNQDLPEEILVAQEKFSQLSNAVKRICSKYGRCAMACRSVITREKELESIIQEAPKVDYGDSLRISGNFVANMKEVRRLDAVKDEVKATADKILKEVNQAAGEGTTK